MMRPYMFTFQPFLRFYRWIHVSSTVFTTQHRFQPFLRFYQLCGISIKLLTQDRFQPFLRFYNEDGYVMLLWRKGVYVESFNPS